MSYTPTGVCKNLLMYDHPVKYAVNVSNHGSILAYQNSFTVFHEFLMSDLLNVHQQCLDALISFLCHWIFITCDPAFNVSVEQNVCRRACETLTMFVCPEVANIVLEQANFLVLAPPRCDSLIDANAGDVPDCINSLDGGKYHFKKN